MQKQAPPKAAYTIRQSDGKFAVYDKDGKFHGRYPSQAAAQAYIADKAQAKRGPHAQLAAATGLALLVLALLAPAPAQAGNLVCKRIPHGQKCWVDGHYFSIRCASGYRVDPPGMGSRCVKVS